MNKELEEAKKILKRRNEELKLTYAITNEDLIAIETVLNYIDNSISKEVIKKKKNQLLEEYKEVIKTNSIKAFIMKCQIEFAEELLEGK